MSDMLPLSSLTPAGIESFRGLLAEASALSIPEVQRRITTVCKNPDWVVVEDADVQINSKERFASRMELARYLDGAFEAKGVKAGPGEAHEGMFTWLAMVFLPTLCRESEGGKLNVKAHERYVLSRSSRDYYRHLVAFPYWIYRQFGDDGIVYLAHPAYVLPNVVEQFASRPYLINSRGVAQVLRKLYWDADKKQLRPGYAREDRNPRRPSPGSILALEITLSQMQCTYDLQSISEQQLLAKLGASKEFEPYLEGVV